MFGHELDTAISAGCYPACEVFKYPFGSGCKHSKRAFGLGEGYIFLKTVLLSNGQIMILCHCSTSKCSILVSHMIYNFALGASSLAAKP